MVHDLDDLLWEERVPRQAQTLDHLVVFKEHAEVLKQFGVTELNLLQVE